MHLAIVCQIVVILPKEKGPIEARIDEGELRHEKGD